MISILGGIAYFLILLIFIICRNMSGQIEATLIRNKPNLHFYALDNNNNLLSFYLHSNKINTRPIVGLVTGDIPIGIDFRPANGKLYLLAKGPSSTRLYTLDLTDPCRVVAIAGPIMRTESGTILVLQGSSFDIDFNPVADRLRIVNNIGQNLRANPDTGVTIIDGNLSFAITDPNVGRTPLIEGVAYTNDFAGALTTTLYDIDIRQGGILVTQAPPNAGTLNTVGSLGLSQITAVTGFDIVTERRFNPSTGLFENFNFAFAIIETIDQCGRNQFGLYRIDLTTGRATLVKYLSNECNSRIVSFAIYPNLNLN